MPRRYRGPALALVLLLVSTLGLSGLAGASLLGGGDDGLVSQTTSTLGLQGLRLPTSPLPGSGSSSGSGPMIDLPEEKEQDEPLDAHGTVPGDGSGAAPLSYLLWGVPLAALALGSVLVTRGLRHQEAPPPDRRAGRPTWPPAPATTPPPPPRPAPAQEDAEAPPTPVPAGPGRAAGSARLEPGVAGLLQLGQRAVAESDYEDAVRWFETAIAAQPRLDVAHHCLGLCLLQLHRPEEAADAFRNAMELAPENPATAYNLAKALVAVGRRAEAIELIVPVLEHYPELFEQFQDDVAFEGVRDHPRLLGLLGRL